jgi:hypothetical protein
MYTDFDDFALIVEINEQEHRYYNAEDEEKRVEELQSDVNKPLVLIKFNPDEYTENGKIIAGSFDSDEEFTKRFTVLKDTISNLSSREITKSEVIHLFNSS